MLSSLVFFAVMSVTAPRTEDLTSLFEAPANVTQAPDGMLVAQAPIHTVALARVAEDGSIVIVCVESSEGAQNFLHKQQTAEPHKAQEK